MRIIITISEIVDRGLWDKLCDLKGYNNYALVDGVEMDRDTEISLTEEEFIKLGLLK